MHYTDCEPEKAYIGEYLGKSYPFVTVKGLSNDRIVGLSESGRAILVSDLNKIRPAVILDSKIFGPGFDESDDNGVEHDFEIGDYVTEYVNEAPEGTFVVGEMSGHGDGTAPVVYRRYSDRWAAIFGSDEIVWMDILKTLPPQNGPYFVIAPEVIGMYEDVWPIGMVINDFGHSGGTKFIKIYSNTWYSQREGREVGFDDVRGTFPNVDPDSFEHVTESMI